MLADVPAADLLAAAESHIQSSEFFPKIAQLRGKYGWDAPNNLGLSGSKNIGYDCEDSVAACEREHDQGEHEIENLVDGHRTRYCQHSCGYYVVKEAENGHETD